MSVPPDTPSVPRLMLESLSKRFESADGAPIQAVRGASLEVFDRESLALIGPSGCGKTTLLRLVAGLAAPDAGWVRIGERDVTRQPPHTRDIAMVFQTLALYPHLTARANISLGLRLRKVPRADIHQRVARLADRLRLGDVLSRKPYELSGGQRQRVALARALARHPSILLLDEPFTHLDSPLRRDLCHELRALQKEFQLTTLLVTHDLPVAKALGNRLAVMYQGHIDQVGTLNELQSSPSTPFVTEFIQSEWV